LIFNQKITGKESNLFVTINLSSNLSYYKAAEKSEIFRKILAFYLYQIYISAILDAVSRI